MRLAVEGERVFYFRLGIHLREDFDIFPGPELAGGLTFLSGVEGREQAGAREMRGEQVKFADAE